MIFARNAQVAMEFIWMTGLAFVLLLVIVSLFAFYLQGYLIDKNEQDAEEFAHALQQEVLVASSAHDGYYRTFVIPNKLGILDINVSINDSFLLMGYNQMYFSLRIPPVTGQLIVGENSIKKVAGEVELN